LAGVGGGWLGAPVASPLWGRIHNSPEISSFYAIMKFHKFKCNEETGACSSKIGFDIRNFVQ
jgi:hypothetical protein